MLSQPHIKSILFYRKRNIFYELERTAAIAIAFVEAWCIAQSNNSRITPFPMRGCSNNVCFIPCRSLRVARSLFFFFNQYQSAIRFMITDTVTCILLYKPRARYKWRVRLLYHLLFFDLIIDLPHIQSANCYVSENYNTQLELIIIYAK